MDGSTSFTLIYPDSLAHTLDAVNAALFDGDPIAEFIRLQVATWIADRQGLPGSYAGMFAPTDFDYSLGAQTFTGEPIRSGAGTGHVLSEEACRVLYRLKVSTLEVREALKRARQGIFHRMEQSEVNGQWSGVYCCGTCSVALWRHLIASSEKDDQRRLANGLEVLKRSRDGKGRWKRFPFFYTLLALSEMNAAQVRDEILYTAPVIERALRRIIKIDPEEATIYDRRKKIVMERVLEFC